MDICVFPADVALLRYHPKVVKEKNCFLGQFQSSGLVSNKYCVQNLLEKLSLYVVLLFISSN